MWNRFYQAFLDTFKIFDEDTFNKYSSEEKELAVKISKTIQLYLTETNSFGLIQLFQKESEYDLATFLYRIKEDKNDIRKNLAESIYLQFHLDQIAASKVSIIHLLKELLRHYYDGFLSGMTQEEGQKQLMDGIFENTQSLEILQEEIQKLQQKIEAQNKTHRRERSGFSILNNDFWEKTKKNASKHLFPNYLLKTDSKPQLLKEIVACKYHIPNTPMKNEFSRMMEQVLQENHSYSLIKILSKGGEGKSTFLLDIAKTHRNSHNIIYFDGIKNASLEKIYQSLEELSPSFNKTTPILILMDNVDTYDELNSLKKGIFAVLYGFNLVFIVVERTFRYLKIKDKEDFEQGFYTVKELKFHSRNINTSIGAFLFKLLSQSNILTDENRQLIQQTFQQDHRKSITENIYASLLALKKAGRVDYSFDWEDWFRFVKENNKATKWKDIFTFIAIFFQFGHRVKSDYCAAFLGIEEGDLIEELEKNTNLPIYFSGDYLLLRHETIASWFFENATNQRKHQEKALYLFKKYLKEINNPFAKDLFIWLSKSAELKDSFLFKAISNIIPNTENKKQVITEWKFQILSKYLALFPSSCKVLIELAKIHYERKKWEAAKNLLLEILKLEEYNIHARTELGKVYQKQEKWTQAEKILSKAIEIEPNSIHSRTELGKVYQKKGNGTKRKRS